jgi:hypothetical protein
MMSIVDIPIIARGRIIMPGDEAVEFKGRGGAAFRQADPRGGLAKLDSGISGFSA